MATSLPHDSNSTQPVEATIRWRGYSDGAARVWFWGAVTCLSVAACMHVGSNRRVYILGFQQPLPEACTLYRSFRMDCPGCGLTRTFVHMMHGEFAAAWQLGPTSLLVFLFFVAQVVLGFAQLILHRRDRWVELWTPWNERIIALLAIALVVQWLIRLGGIV